MFSSAGVGSGLDVPAMIDGLMGVERVPLVKLQNRQGGIQAKISAFGSLKGIMSSFNDSLAKFSDVSKIKSHSVSSSDKAVLTTSVSGSPIAAKYAIDVVSLAQSHKISSSLFANATDPVGEGTLSISVAGTTTDFTFAAGSNSLNDIRDSLNSKLLSQGIQATIVNVNGGSRLMVSTNNSGVSNAITMTVSGDIDGNNTDTLGLSQLVFDPAGVQNMSEVSAPLDAQVKVDGFLASSSSNTFSTTITGVSFDVKSVGVASLSVNKDDSELKNSIADVVSSYNNLQNVLVGLKGGGLKGESMISSIGNKIRGSFSSQNSSAAGMNASKMGVEFDRYGNASFNETTFNDLSDVDKKEALAFLSEPKIGLAARLTEVVSAYTKSEGFIDAITTGLDNQVNHMDNSIVSMQRRLVNREITLGKQFTALDTLMAGLEATSGFLTQQLDAFQATDNQR